VTRHVDAETLARYRQGDLRRWQAWRVRAHLARCAQCRELSSELAEVTGLLASVPAPQMPDHLMTRIQGALAHEAAVRASAPATAQAAEVLTATAQPTTAQPTQPKPARRQRQRRQWLPEWPGAGVPAGLRIAAAAAVIVVIAVGGYEVSQHVGGTSSHSSAAPRAGVPFAAPAQSYGPALHYRHSGQEDTITPITTHTDFTAAQLNSQVSQLSGTPAPGTSAPAAGQSRPYSSGATSPRATFGNVPVASLSGCLNRIDAGGLVLLVDVAEFQGTPAVILLTEASQTSPKQIWVVGTACSASRSDILDQGVLTPGS
jgi:anti-sigma factor ChrR (cupin superfamily)